MTAGVRNLTKIREGDMNMVIGIIGLGLIGGSFAKAYKTAGHTVYAHDIDAGITDFAVLSGVADAALDEAATGLCDLILIAVYPREAVDYLNGAASAIKPGTFVIDCCGTKRGVCEAGFRAASRYGFTFVGGHPMAGSEQSGFKHSRADMFKGASMIIIPPVYDDIKLLDKIKRLLTPAEFGRMTITTAEKHDAMIAFTSQMAHLAASAYIKSPTLQAQNGFTAGSFKDMTRVAKCNECMWTELFLENKDNLLFELDTYINALRQYREALDAGDADGLRKLLRDGSRIKEEADKK